jgi:hypothetical protein
VRVRLHPAFFICAACASSQPAPGSTQKEFADPNAKTVESLTTWAGEPITIENDAVDFVSGPAGTLIVVDPTTRRVSATATFTARASDDAHGDEAASSIADAKQAFGIDGFTVKCHHGQTHGSSRSGSAGCKQLKVTIPAGTTDLPLELRVVDVNGGITISGPLITKTLVVEEKGTGTVSVEALPNAGATILVRAGFDVRVLLPKTFAADHITLRGGTTTNDIDTSAFLGLSNDAAFGTPGAGAALLDVSTSTVGTITLVRL